MPIIVEGVRTPFATPSDVAAVWRPLSADETTQAEVRISRASAMLRLALPGIDDRVAADPDVAEQARGVVVDAVLRVLKNPDGKKTESIDDYSWTRDGAISSGSLYISADEIASLTPMTVGLGAAFVVSLGG